MLKRDRHVGYFKRCLGVLPTAAEAEDSNKMAIVYFSVAGLDLLDALDKIDKEEITEWLYGHLIDRKDCYGFRGSMLYAGTGLYDPPNLAATLFALQTLLILGDPLKKVDRHRIMEYVVKCQRWDGSFAPNLDLESGVPFGEEDTRYCMIAASIRRLVGAPSEEDLDIDIDGLEKYVRSILAFDGGLAMGPLCESHAGLTYCGLDALKLVGRLNPEDWQDTLDFLVHRQLAAGESVDEGDIGGFNGRLNKYADTCYCFWSIASLRLLDSDLEQQQLVAEFLLDRTQNELMGGFNKTADDDGYPDPLHSFLGLATLSLLQKEELPTLDPTIVISKRALEKGH